MEIGGTPLAIDAPLEVFSASISEYLLKIQPDLVITHGSNGEYGHPQHIYTHQAVRNVFEEDKPDAALVTWQAWHEPFSRPRVLNQDDPADIIRDIADCKTVKVKAALCHKTQHAMFLRNTGVKKVEEMIWNFESFKIWSGLVPKGLL